MLHYGCETSNLLAAVNKRSQVWKPSASECQSRAWNMQPTIKYGERSPPLWATQISWQSFMTGSKIVDAEETEKNWLANNKVDWNPRAGLAYCCWRQASLTNLVSPWVVNLPHEEQHRRTAYLVLRVSTQYWPVKDKWTNKRNERTKKERNGTVTSAVLNTLLYGNQKRWGDYLIFFLIYVTSSRWWTLSHLTSSSSWILNFFFRLASAGSACTQ